jgi:hypothetical protein
MSLISELFQEGRSMKRTRLCLLLICSAACGGKGNATQSQVADSGVDAAVADPPPAESEFHAVVREFLAEYNREVEVTCPCRVEQMAFTSLEECIGKTGEKPELVDCVSTMLAPDDTPELRDVLRCRTNQTKLRSDCLEASTCDADQTNACYEMAAAMQCAVLDPQLLTRVVYGCPDAMLLAR